MTSAVKFINTNKEFADQPIINNLNLQINPERYLSWWESWEAERRPR